MDTQRTIVRDEDRHARRLAEIADAVVEAHAARGVKTVLVSGPTSSGKTTFARRLCEALGERGLAPVQISMDDYFVDRDKTPLDENGEYDFETLASVDLDLLNRQLKALTSGESVTLPLYDFISGTRKWHTEPLRLADNSIIVMEGIHALNPSLTPLIPDDAKFMIFIACFTSPVLADGERVAPSDVRLLRRITRDNAQRGYSAGDTLAMWGKVRRGEERNIFPYQGNADTMFDSSLSYELSILRPCVEPLLRAVAPDHPQRAEAERLLGIVTRIEPVSGAAVPPDSLLGEFACR